MGLTVACPVQEVLHDVTGDVAVERELSLMLWFGHVVFALDADDAVLDGVGWCCKEI